MVGRRYVMKSANSNTYCRFKMKWALLKIFPHCFLTDKFKAVNHAMQTWEFSNCIYIFVKNVVEMNNSAMKFVILFIQNWVSRSYYGLLVGRGRIWGLRLTVPPLFSQPLIVALRPSNGKNFTLNYRFQQSDFFVEFWTKKALWQKISLMGWLLRFKSVIL